MVALLHPWIYWKAPFDPSINVVPVALYNVGIDSCAVKSEVVLSGSISLLIMRLGSEFNTVKVSPSFT